MAKAIRWMAAVSLLAGGSGLAVAQNGQATAPSASAAEIRQVNALQEVLNIPSVTYDHPDLRYRNIGIEAYKDGDKTRALEFYLLASRYADKVSQAMVAMMYWNGEGTAMDRPRAYAWMDLAADRGYRDLLVQREIYWSKLSGLERDEALRVGREIYAEYSDEQGLHRLELRLSTVRTHVTGSHLGWAGNGKTLFSSGVTLPGAGSLLGQISGATVDFSKLYSSALWNPEQYERLKDLQWELKMPLQSHVEVGELQNVPANDPSQPPS